MATVTLISPTTAAVATHVPFETNGYGGVTLIADNLAGAEEVDVFIGGTQTWETFYANGGVVVLTATIPSVTLPPGPTYAVLKDGTVASCGVYAAFTVKDPM